MPLYICNAKPGAIDDECKQAIAKDITRIHCEVADAPPQFVHTIFLEAAARPPLEGKTASLFGSIRAGRTEAQKRQITETMSQSIERHAGTIFASSACRSRVLSRYSSMDWACVS